MTVGEDEAVRGEEEPGSVRSPGLDARDSRSDAVDSVNYGA